MEVFSCKCLFAFILTCSLLLSTVLSAENVRAVNLGGWLVVEEWMTPYLFDGITNGDMLDGRQVQFKSVPLQKYVVAEDGGGSTVGVNRDSASGWETFKGMASWGGKPYDSSEGAIEEQVLEGFRLITKWAFCFRDLQYYGECQETKFQFRSFNGDFLSCVGEGCLVSATAKSPSETETFEIIRNDNGRVHIKLSNGPYVQTTSSNQLTANYPGVPGWDDNMATFEMTILPDKMGGEYQLSNGHGPDKATEVLTKHRTSYITGDDFRFMSQNGINTVRIPVGWWIAQDPTPPHPYVGGSLDALDKAFSWAQAYNIKCIIDLHAAPGSQNGKDHSSSRDGSIDWPSQIPQSLDVIEFLAQRYAPHPALLGIELLNEPLAPGVSMDVLVPYYASGYQIVRKYSPTAYVIVCQRIGSPDSMELFRESASIGSSNLVVDLHWYSLYDSSFDQKSVEENIQFIYDTRRSQIQSSNSANGPLVFIGEWVNEMAMRGGSQTDYQNFGKAQLDVYGEASFGWAYWTLKNAQEHWDFKWNIQNKYLLLGDNPSK